MYSLLLENKPTSIYSHLTRNKKWKLWVGWHGSSCWLLFLCVLCFVFCAASKQSSVLKCHHTILYFEKWKSWAMFLASFFVDQITTGKITTGKRYSRLAVGWNKSQITICRLKRQTPTITWKNTNEKKVQSSARWLEYMSKYEHQLRPEKITNRKKVQSSLLHHLQHT